MSEKAAKGNKGFRAREELSILLQEFVREGDSATAVVKQEWAERYQVVCGELMQEYFECVRSEDYESAYVLNRQIYSLAKRTKHEAQRKEDAYLYAMGVFNGVYAACKKMTELKSEEQIFYIRMSKIVERKHMKDILKYVYRNERVRNGQICAALQIQSNLLSKALHPLLDVDCLIRFGTGKNTFYSLSLFGKNYVRKVLGYTANDIVEERVPVLASYTTPRRTSVLQYMDEPHSLNGRSFVSTGSDKYQREDMYGRDKENYTGIRGKGDGLARILSEK